MSFYDVALFVHVVAAVALIGGSGYAHLSIRLLERSRTVDAARGHVSWLATFSRSSGPLALTVLGAGLYLSFAGNWWGAGWPGVSLGLFALGGVLAPAILDPGITRMRTRLEDEPEGPFSDELLAAIADPRVTRVSWMLFGVDLAIVLLMTAKPAFGPSLVVAAVGIGLGLVLGERARRRGRVPRPTAPPAAPAV